MCDDTTLMAQDVVTDVAATTVDVADESFATVLCPTISTTGGAVATSTIARSCQCQAAAASAVTTIFSHHFGYNPTVWQGFGRTAICGSAADLHAQ